MAGMRVGENDATITRDTGACSHGKLVMCPRSLHGRGNVTMNTDGVVRVTPAQRGSTRPTYVQDMPLFRHAALAYVLLMPSRQNCMSYCRRVEVSNANDPVAASSVPRSCMWASSCFALSRMLLIERARHEHVFRRLFVRNTYIHPPFTCNYWSLDMRKSFPRSSPSVIITCRLTSMSGPRAPHPPTHAAAPQPRSARDSASASASASSDNLACLVSHFVNHFTFTSSSSSRTFSLRPHDCTYHTPMGKLSDFFRSDRYRSQARLHADQRTKSTAGDSTGGAILPLYQAPDTLTKAGGLDEQDAGRGPPSGPTAREQGHGGDGSGGGGDAAEDGGARAGGSTPEGLVTEKPGGGVPKSATPPASRPDTEAPRDGDSAVKSTPGHGAEKPPITKRMLAGSKRFVKHTKKALFRSWINLLLVFVPIGIIAEALNLNPSLVFAMNAIAIVPLAGLLSFATECVAARMGDTLGALLNVSFGNAVELIIFIIALVKDEIAIVQASLLGSILANLLLILGMAFLFGGLRYREQIYNSTVTQMSACLLSLSVMSLLLPVSYSYRLSEKIQH